LQNETQDNGVKNNFQPNPNIKIQKIKLLKDDDRIEQPQDNQNTNQHQASPMGVINNSETLNYKDIYQKQKYFENMKVFFLLKI
jgi:hypothetical protein